MKLHNNFNNNDDDGGDADSDNNNNFDNKINILTYSKLCVRVDQWLSEIYCLFSAQRSFRILTLRLHSGAEYTSQPDLNLRSPQIPTDLRQNIFLCPFRCLISISSLVKSSRLLDIVRFVLRLVLALLQLFPFYQFFIVCKAFLSPS